MQYAVIYAFVVIAGAPLIGIWRGHVWAKANGKVLRSTATSTEQNLTPDISTVLDEAENVVNVAGPAIVADEEEARERAEGGSWWDRMRSSFRRPR